MTQAVARILEEAEQLSAPERAELADRIVERLAHDIPLEVAAAQMTEVRRHLAEARAGVVSLIPGDEALERVRRAASSWAKRPLLPEYQDALASGALTSDVDSTIGLSEEREAR